MDIFDVSILDQHELMLLAALGIVVVAVIVHWTNRVKKEANWIPYAPGYSMFETIQRFSGSDVHLFMHEMSQKACSANFRLNLPINMTNGGAYVIGDPELVRNILTDPTTDKSEKMGEPFNRFHNGQKSMFTQSNSDPSTRIKRKGTMQAFSKNQVGRMNKVAQKLVDDLITERMPNYSRSNKPFDPAYEMNRMTFRVICEAAFEYINMDDEEYHKLVLNLDGSLREFILRQLANPFRGIFGIFLPSVREAYKQANAVNEFARKILEEYYAKVHKSSDPTLIKLIHENPAMQEKSQKATELTDWLIAGHDTTGYSLSNTLVMLAKYPRVQEKLRQATKGVDKPHLTPYFQCVIREVMRMIPVAALGSVRVTGREHTSGKYIVPKGAICFLSQYHAGRNPEVYEKPNEFRPERWENPTKKMLMQHAPFSLGSRNCPGQALAMAEINLTIPRLLQNYKFELEDEGKLDFFLTLKFLDAKLRIIKI